MVKKQYTKEFKLGAVKLVVDRGMTPVEAAKDLGVSYYTLKNWINAFKVNKGDSFPGKGILLPGDQRIRDLEKKLKRTEMERDLLKKTIVFFAELDRKSSLQ
jgi:transposase